MIKFIKYIILGLIQGITEPLPISSSGHLKLIENILNEATFSNIFDAKTFNFEVISNFGSFLAILFIFRKEIIKLIQNFFLFIFNKEKREKNKDGFMYVIKLIISTIPVGIVGILLKDFFEENISLTTLAISFIFTALMLFAVRNINGNKESKDITIKDAIIIGLFQMITIIPGVSRSGTVLVACLVCKLKRDDALKYTFMLYFPVSAAAMLLKIPDIINTPNNIILPYISGMFAAMIVTYFSYVWLSNIVKKGSLWKFSIYCLLLSLFIIIYSIFIY